MIVPRFTNFTENFSPLGAGLATGLSVLDHSPHLRLYFLSALVSGLPALWDVLRLLSVFARLGVESSRIGCCDTDENVVLAVELEDEVDISRDDFPLGIWKLLHFPILLYTSPSWSACAKNPLNPRQTLPLVFLWMAQEDTALPKVRTVSLRSAQAIYGD